MTGKLLYGLEKRMKKRRDREESNALDKWDVRNLELVRDQSRLPKIGRRKHSERMGGRGKGEEKEGPHKARDSISALNKNAEVVRAATKF